MRLERSPSHGCQTWNSYPPLPSTPLAGIHELNIVSAGVIIGGRTWLGSKFWIFGQEMCHSNLNPAILLVGDAICQKQIRVHITYLYLFKIPWHNEFSWDDSSENKIVMLLGGDDAERASAWILMLRPWQKQSNRLPLVCGHLFQWENSMAWSMASHAVWRSSSQTWKPFVLIVLSLAGPKVDSNSKWILRHW